MPVLDVPRILTGLRSKAIPFEKLGGKICVAKTAVPQMGYFAICEDTENNTFAIWERNPGAK